MRCGLTDFISAGWRSGILFVFLLVSLVTLCYLNFLNQATRVNWIWLFLSSVALVYSNYFGWALLGCLALDFAIRNAECIAAWWMPFLGTGALLLIAYTPLFAAFLTEMHHGPHADFHALSVAATGVYNLYCLFVSESVAPWYWIAGVSAGLAIAVCLILTLLVSSWPVRRFLLYFAALFFVMTVLGIIQPKRVMLISPWLILPLGVALATLPRTIRSPDDSGIAHLHCCDRVVGNFFQKAIRRAALD